MSAIMGPQTQAAGSNPSGFDASSINAQLGAQGMSLNMFGGRFSRWETFDVYNMDILKEQHPHISGVLLGIRVLPA